ncbi:MAG TPA: HNH endonuclease signature motif containing protein [Pyrinomonadaceae bacterium]|nr:HNH endonuclease signature motif containing protein [Pyrinomonadaceae bacterium]
MNQARMLASLRREVRERAGERCEYCLLAESQALVPHEPDHLIALKHDGQTTSENLALACFVCNRFKGSDIASIDAVTSEIVGLFNPRIQVWFEHFRLDGAYIVPLTAAGRVTEKLLQFNLPSRVAARARFIEQGKYP